MSNSKGFTLVELTITIVILGILAVAAAPRFINVQTDAVIAKVQAMEGTVKSATKLMNAKAIILGLEKQASASIDIGGINADIVYGYPDVYWMGTFRYIINLDDVPYLPNTSVVCESDWCGQGNQINVNGVNTIGGRMAVVVPNGYSIDDLCLTYYISPENGDEPVIFSDTTGC